MEANIGWVLLGLIIVLAVIALIYILFARPIIPRPVVTPTPGGVPLVPPDPTPVINPTSPVVNPGPPIVNRSLVPQTGMEPEVTPQVANPTVVNYMRSSAQQRFRAATLGQLIQEANGGVPLPSIITSNAPWTNEVTLAPQPIPTSNEVIVPDGENGWDANGSIVHDDDIATLTDSRYVLRGDYPGINVRDNEVLFTRPHRHSIRLCRDGGFLVRWGRGTWQHVSLIRIDGTDVQYLQSGFFMYGDRSRRSILCPHEDHAYIINIERA